MKKITVTLLSLAGLVATTQAAVTWQSAQDISADTDVSTNGDLVFAYSFTASEGGFTSVNGVNFFNEWIQNGSSGYTDGDLVVSGGSFRFNGYEEASTSTYGGTNPAFQSLSQNYKDILTGGRSVSSWVVSPDPLPTDRSIELRYLTIGQKYEVQIWCNDADGYFRDTNWITFTSPANSANTVTVDANTSGTEGVGQYVIGTFTADAESEIIGTEFGYQSNGAPINAIQLRAIPSSTLKLVVFSN